MTLWQLVVAGALRNKLRFTLTVLGVAAVIAGLVLVRTVSDVWEGAVKGAAQNKIIVRSALALENELPADYADKIQALDQEVVSISKRWALDVQAEGRRSRRVVVEAADVEGIIMPSEVAWPRGTQVKAKGWPEMAITGTKKGVAQARPGDRPPTELIVTIGSPVLAAMLARKIDAAFADAKVPTISQSEHDAAVRSAAALGGLFTVIDLVSATLLLVLGLVVASMIVFSTGERTTEYAVLRALGFSPALVGFCVSGEALIIAVTGATLGLLGGVLGAMAIRYVSADAALGTILPETFSVSASTLVLGFVAAASLALLASLLPALRASQVAVADELRRQG